MTFGISCWFVFKSNLGAMLPYALVDGMCYSLCENMKESYDSDKLPVLLRTPLEVLEVLYYFATF